MTATSRPELGHLRWRADDDVLIILDVEAGQYHAIGADAHHRFLEYANGAEDSGLEASLTDAGLLRQHHETSETHKPLALPGELPMAVKTLLAARRNLNRRKFRSSLDWALAHRPGRPRPGAIKAFRKAEGFFPSPLGDFDCLPRALGLFAFLRHAAMGPEFVVGFKRYPFTAHAWVEVDGAPVLETRSGKNRIASFHEILRAS